MTIYDIIVCGAGAAGFCAAAAAAGMGMRTALIEKYNILRAVFLPFLAIIPSTGSIALSEKKKMVVAGIGREFVLRFHKERSFE